MFKSALLVMAGLLVSSGLFAGEPAKPAETTVMALDKGSFVMFMRWKTPVVVGKDGKQVPLLEPAKKNQKEEERKPRAAVAADAPDKDWAALEFDDSRWLRILDQPYLHETSPGHSLFYVPGAPIEWNLFCLRGRFRVEDPGQVKDLKLSLRYIGGARVFVNGKELCRSHLPEGNIGFDTPAEIYPDEAYARPGAKADGKELMKVRTRELAAKDGTAGVVIPASMLRKGVNIVAVENHAAPLGEAMLKDNQPDNLNWSHAGILELKLTAAAGVASAWTPSQGIELWTSPQMNTDYYWQYALPAEQVRPIRIVGAKNGAFSGKVVLSSGATIKAPKATVSELVSADGKSRIPASAVHLRWAEKGAPQVTTGLYWDVPCRTVFDRLLSEFPAEIPALNLRALPGSWSGNIAVMPIWVTVNVPADAAAGQYKGTLNIEAQGASAVKFAVPVELSVADWRLPDPKNFVIHHNIYQSPDTLARYYNVPLWSDKHWELIGRSFDVMAQVGNKLCVLTLAEKSPAMDNAESMIRWVKKPDGSYDYDFTIMDKYLDLYAAKCGKPGILQMNVWENSDRGRLDKNDKNPPPPPLAVTVLDPATGKTESLNQPAYGSPENEAFWKPVFTELRKRLEKRGWFDVAAEVDAGYCLPPLPENVTVFKHLWPDGKWMSATHSCPQSFGGKNKEDSMPCPYVEWVWGAGSLYDPDFGDRQKVPFYPREWKRGNTRILLANVRYGCQIVHALRDGSPLINYRMISEAALQGGLRGTGRLGGDFWPLPTGKADRFLGIGGNYGGCSWNESVRAMTSPGPDGAIFNTRLESFREGVQLSEAILFIQQALESGKVSEDLVKRAAEVFDERARYYLRGYFYFSETHLNNGSALVCSNWQERDAKLLALAAEIAKATGGK